MDNKKIKIRFIDAVRILKPYLWGKMSEQLVAVIPIIFYLGLFQIIVLRTPLEDAVVITGGLFAVIIGLMFFMEGLRLGLMPFGEIIGNTLPQRSSLKTILIFAFILGIGATLAEPAIGVLKLAGESVHPEKAPLLKALLTIYSMPLVIFVGIGVGIATVLGTMRFIYNWSLKPLIYIFVMAAAALTIVAHFDEHTRHIIGLAWDCGGVTTGPVTVPLVLSLGIGISASMGKSDSGMAGFGVVTLASVLPIIMVLILGLSLNYFIVGDYDVLISKLNALVAASNKVVEKDTLTLFWERPIVQSIYLAVRAIVPLIIYLYIMQKFILKESIKRGRELALGIVFAVFGMSLFNFGLTEALDSLGKQVGKVVPNAFLCFNDGSYVSCEESIWGWHELLQGLMLFIFAIFTFKYFKYFSFIIRLSGNLSKLFGYRIRMESFNKLFSLIITVLFSLLLIEVFNKEFTIIDNLELIITPTEAGNISLYGLEWGILVAVLFAFFMGYGATLAEPALNALGQKVEDITQGAFKKSLLMQAVAFGVAIGLGLGISKIIFGWDLVWLLVPPYMGLMLITFLSTEQFVNIGWDSAGVTTGPITVPLVIAMGLGVGGALEITEGFGIISMASLCPITTVLLLGLMVKKNR